MIRIVLYSTLIGAFVTIGAGICETTPVHQGLSDCVTQATQEPAIDDYFGMKIRDPYRWMEIGPSDAHFVAFLRAQNLATEAALRRLSVPRAKLLTRIQAFDSVVAITHAWRRVGDRIFFLEIQPNATNALLRVREANKVRTLVDPEDYRTSDRHASIDYFVPSNEGTYVLFGTSLGGSENSTLRVLEVSTGKVLSDTISRTQYGFPSWRSDGKSFFYFRQKEMLPDASPTAMYEGGRTFLHTLGSNPEGDLAVFGPGLPGSRNVPMSGFSNVLTAPDSPYVIAFWSAGTTDGGSVYVAHEREATGPTTRWRQVLSSEDRLSTGESPAALTGKRLYLLSNKDSQNGTVLALDLGRPRDPPKTVLQASERVLLGIYCAKDALYVCGRRGVDKTLYRVPYDDRPKLDPIKLPVQGEVFGIDASPNQSGILFGLESWIVAPIAYRYDPVEGKIRDTGLQPKNLTDFSAFEVHEVQAQSTDRVNVPISIICRKDITLDGSHPTIVEGYGAYGISIDPVFNPTVFPSIFAWVERGGVIALAHVRGGGEYGERWHAAGQKEAKQHTVDDVVATAHYLISKGYSSSPHLAVRGTSAGGIAAGNIVVQQPQLFAAAIDNAGLTNMLRFQLTAGGPGNIPEFGDVTKPSEFKWLYAVSAYHHIQGGTKYPAVLALTGINDPRVPSWIVAEFAARLQCATASAKPVLLRVDFDAGHGAGSSRDQRQSSAADEQSFLLWQLGDNEFQPKLVSATQTP